MKYVFPFLLFLSGALGKPQKKVHPLVAGPLRGGGGGKGRAIKEKRTFLKTFFLFCCLK